MNIFKELNTDIGMPIPQTGNLSTMGQAGCVIPQCIPDCTEAGAPAESFPGRMGRIHGYCDPETYLSLKKNLVFFLMGEICAGKTIPDR